MKQVTLIVMMMGAFAATAAGQVIPGDANLDDLVDLMDFGFLKDHFTDSPATWAMGDFNGDNIVDLQDFGILKVHFGEGTGAPAVGAITDPGSGALQLTLTIDVSTGAATIDNNTGSHVSIDGYEIWSAGSHLDPVGWQSISDWFIHHPIIIGDGPLGPGMPLFGDLAASSGLLAEGNLAFDDPELISGKAFFPPGMEFPIGNPILPGAASETDLSFYYKLYDEPGGDKWLGEIVIVPEPATAGLLLVGCGGMMYRKKARVTANRAKS